MKKQSFPSVRRIIQLIFLFITLYIGVQFYGFATQLETGEALSILRPPGVEAFLPISALVSLKYFLFTGIFNRVHPSALVLFLIICTTAFAFKKGFCSWVCPIGLFSDLLTRLHLAFFKKRIQLPKWPDLGLRSIKYALAAFLIWNIFIKMPATAAGQFIQSPYNRFADIKMLKFFTDISPTAALVILILVVLSIIIPNFWCRYLCPYGALLGCLSLFSLGRIKRNSPDCIHCKKCETVCPGRIQITQKATVNSLECCACLRCVDACPQKNVIEFSLFPNISMPSKRIALALITLFSLGIITAKQTGYWQSETSEQAYRRYFLSRQMPQTRPQRLSSQKMDPEKMKRMLEMMKKMKTSS